MRPFFTQADIDRLYRDPDAPAVEFSAELIEHYIRRGRVLRAQVAADLLGRAVHGIWRLASLSWLNPAGRLKPSNV